MNGQENKRMRATKRRAILVGCSLGLLACGGDDGGPSGANQGALCNAETLEADLDSSPFNGPGVDPTTGELKLEPGSTYVISSTYGAPKPGPNDAPVTERYLELFAAIEEQLKKEPGLLAMKLASSDACGSGRTLAVWKSEEEMYDFVTSAAHLAAMREANEVLKPGYAVTHWNATTLDQTSWQEAVRQVKAND